MPETSNTIAAEFELMLARAFDRAWSSFVEAAGPQADTAENRGSLAARLMVLATLGESNELALADTALLFMRALTAAKGLSDQSPKAQAPPGPVLDPAGIEVACAAYEACLQELPDGISADARSSLLKSILANAGNGLRDRVRLQSLAMEALRSRDPKNSR
jgi:hypothetical protein